MFWVYKNQWNPLCGYDVEFLNVKREKDSKFHVK